MGRPHLPAVQYSHRTRDGGRSARVAYCSAEVCRCAGGGSVQRGPGRQTIFCHPVERATSGGNDRGMGYGRSRKGRTVKRRNRVLGAFGGGSVSAGAVVGA